MLVRMMKYISKVYIPGIKKMEQTRLRRVVHFAVIWTEISQNRENMI